MGHDYLLKEYELCFEQLRFYDQRNESILKYISSLASAAATAQFAIYQYLHSATVGFFRCQAFLSGLVFLATLLLGMAMLQNRLYFVFVARQLNAIRGYLMRVEAGGFKNNQLYTSTNFSALKPFSVHTFQLLGAVLISSTFAGITAYAIRPALGDEACILPAALTCLFVLAAEAVGGATYLYRSSKKTADEAVHRQNPAS